MCVVPAHAHAHRPASPGPLLASCAACGGRWRWRVRSGSSRFPLATIGGDGDKYIVGYSIGDPPQPAEAVVDTTTDLIWTQCSTCLPTCFRQNLPYYDFSRSRTVGEVPSNGTLCGVPPTVCARGGGAACAVNARYASGKALGFLATEVFTFQTGTTTLAFGCINETTISPAPLNGASGIIRLGRGALSLVNQLGDTSDGETERRSGGAPVTTVPFAENPKAGYPFSSFYYLPLVGLSVGDASVAVPAGAFDLRQVAPGAWAGGALIDSGVPFTRLVDPVHRALKQELARQLGDSLVCRRRWTRATPRSCAWRDLVVPPVNYWALVDASPWCMVVVSSAHGNGTLPMNETTVIGGYMQQDMHVLYDLANGVVSFQPADCSTV
ncbi:hypothetical protein E2562_020127 [Oryza meyeriana var. granulata]|uniref:Peptidase A1 domain-containing protein n=1 Tax=Oryza meyeriana var. granulata TaxID=110450 RepID=A0A6G1BLR1_9ORYZ|nr:hypothetical protein E2562_020127 [Oryza meyeriana var. granulata]